MTLLLGGARSGKRDMVVALGRQWSGPVTFVATAEARDDDMAKRIRDHQADRPAHWKLLERPRLGVEDVDNLPENSLVIIDCLTLLVSNLMLDGHSQAAIVRRLGYVAVRLAARKTPTLVVSNEVGLGVHPATEMGAQYRDTLGRVNTHVASLADDVLLAIAGRVLPLADLELDLSERSNEAPTHEV